MGILTNVLFTSGPNLVIPAPMGHKLSYGQACDWYTDRQTDMQKDTGNDNTRRQKLATGKNESHRRLILFKFKIVDII